MARVTVNADKMAEVEKAKRRENADRWFAEEIAKGFSTESGITLGLSSEDVSLLTGNYLLAKEAAALDMPLPALVDTNGTAHPIGAIEELTAIMLAYGQKRAELSAQYAALLSPAE